MTGHALTDFFQRECQLHPSGQIVLSMVASGENVVITTDLCVYLMKPDPIVGFTLITLSWIGNAR